MTNLKVGQTVTIDETDPGYAAYNYSGLVGIIERIQEPGGEYIYLFVPGVKMLPERVWVRAIIVKPLQELPKRPEGCIYGRVLDLTK